MPTTQNEYPLPSNGNNKFKTSGLVPRFYRTDSNKKFLQATLDQLVQPGVVKKVNGYIGRQNAKSSIGTDIFVSTTDDDRKNYQLEPSLTVTDTLGNIDYYKDYIDYINQLSVFGANVSNHERLNRQEFYSWNPHIDWDKFVNFQQYYWLPYGPDVIDVYGQQRAIESTFTIAVEDEGDVKEYLFTPNGLTRNPVLKLYRGQTYYFEINSPGEPFSIKTDKTVGNTNRYHWGLDTSYAIEKGTMKFTVPDDAPNILFYVSENDANLGGVFKVYDIKENTAIDVEMDLLGKKTYKLPNGTALSNGMKLRFRGNVTPAKYASDLFYVEGVGTKIHLVAEKDLEIISNYSDSFSVPFDDTGFDGFPFDVASSYSNKKDYVLINRASKDRNPWSRYNRWFHKDVIDTSAAYNGKIPSIDQTSRAIRPIIEFEAGLKLFNFGVEAVADIDLIDTYTIDAFSTIEGQLGYTVDGIQLVNGHRILFVADTDILVKNKVFRVEFIEITPPGENRRRQIRLVEETSPAFYQTALIKYGLKNSGLTYWYNGSAWIKGQVKTYINQAPLFDVFDADRYSFSDTSVYDGSTFAGTKLFSYAVGTSTADSELGFSLKHKNINNVGDILFNFNLLNDTFIYKTLVDVKTITTNIGSLIKADGLSLINYVNGWEISNATRYQPVVRIYKNSQKFNNFDLDVYSDLENLDDLEVRVYVNGKRLDKSKWSLVIGSLYKKIVLNNDITNTDVLTIRSFTKQPKNNNGYYEIPVNLQNNPLNNDIGQFTLGEVIDHVDSIIDNLSTFIGSYPGFGNLRDLGNISPYGTRFVQHSGAMPLSMYHITSKNSNIIKALQEARDDYGKFKREFILSAENLGIDTDTIKFIELVLADINKNKPKTAPYYFSDMVPYGSATVTNITVVDYRTATYPLSTNFTLSTLTPQAVLIYVNNVQLVHGIDYTFDGAGFVVINSSKLVNDDIITIVEYENTDGCFIPSTPTKLGLYPKYEPKIYLDTSLVNPVWVIQGHDGSITAAYGTYGVNGTPDYRDALLLELEKRIFNNIKVDYNPDLFDIHDYIPRYNVNSDYSLDEFNAILAPNFYQWMTLIDRDFTKPTGYNGLNPFTFNYVGHYTPDGRNAPGYWRGIYRWLFDTDRPHLCPWEMLGFSIEPSWWTEVYGPLPYTYNNFVMWQDISEGAIKEPGKPVVRLPKYARSYLLDCIPANENGLLRDPIEANIVQGVLTNSISDDFIFGDGTPVETAWRRSSYYPFTLIASLILTRPSEVMGLLFDRSRIVRDLSGQIVYKDTQVRTKLSSVILPNLYADASRIQTSGLINYLIDYIQSDNLKSLTQYRYDLENLNVQLSYRIAGFTEKEKFNLLLDSKNPTAVGGVFVPQENYSIVLNTSSPVKKVTYSGVLITKTPGGYEVKGYSPSSPYFTYFPYIRQGYIINIGGISETYSLWDINKQYLAGKIVKASQTYYRVAVTHTSTTEFQSEYFVKLPGLPMIGGQDAYIRTEWDTTSPIVVPYGSRFRTAQEVVDFLLGYGAYLESIGFVFNNYNINLNAVTNWETSAKEFLFWTTQNWSGGAVVDWAEKTKYIKGDLIRYQKEYYRVIKSLYSGDEFNREFYENIDEPNSIGASVIALSPSATSLILKLDRTVVEDVTDAFNGYEFFRPDGQKLEPEFINSYREDNTVEYTPSDVFGIFGATFYLIQKEHILLLDNTTLFNDTIYEQTTGYRQEKIKISAYISMDWNGGFDIPGFIYDQALIKNWEPWTDYNLGDIVKYKEFYYASNSFLPGTEEFNSADWNKLSSKPKSRMLPNWSYKAEQFTDFYSLDSDNFDVGQQKMAQHLIGYQKRQYLENIIKDDISEYKFYQGMIIEKGTQNVLNKLFDVLSADNLESIKFFEEWAIRVGDYGSSSSYDEYEFVLDEALFKLSPQPYELINLKNEVLDFTIRQTPNDVYLKPLGYNSNPWPVLNNYIPFLRTPGYVRLEDVARNYDTISEVLLEDPITLVEGSYLWCAFDTLKLFNNKPKIWSVYRVTSPAWSVSALVYDKNAQQLTITTTINHHLSPGDIVILNNTPANIAAYQLDPTANPLPFTGAVSAFRVNFVVDGTNFILYNILSANYPDPDTNIASNIAPYVITEQRIPSPRSIDDANLYIPSRLQVNELLWVDDNGNNQWTVYQHNNVYAPSTFNNSSPSDLQAYGKTIAADAASQIVAIATGKDQVLIYKKAGIKTKWIQQQTIILSAGSVTVPTGHFGDTLELSPDGIWLVIGSPRANAGYANQGIISIYKRDANGEYILARNITNPNAHASGYFGSTIKFSGNTNLFVTETNQVYQISYQSNAWTLNPVAITQNNTSQFGAAIAASGDGTMIAISDPASTIAVFPYMLVDGIFQPLTPLSSDQSNSQFGVSIALSTTGEFLAVGSSYYDYTNPDVSMINEGKVSVFKMGDTTYATTPVQIINSRNPENNELFGTKIAFMNDYSTLVIYSLNGDSVDPVTFAPSVNSGRIDIYDIYNNTWIYGESITSTDAHSAGFGTGFSVTNNHVFVSAPQEVISGYEAGVVYDYQKPAGATSWSVYRQEQPKIDLQKIKKIFIYNKKINELIDYIDIIDPLQGNIAGIADQEIKFKTYYDPAIYSTDSVNPLVNKDNGMQWTSKNVGTLWWDLTRAKFIDPYNGDVIYRNANWNTLYPTASIDIYEWVESPVKPSQWDSQADTVAGIAQGFSGTSLHGDSAYSVKQNYDITAKVIKSTYYFWVKNKTIVPNVANRNLSALDVADLIANPKGNMYPYIAFTGTNSFSLANIAQHLVHTDVHLSVELWTSNDYDINEHSQWAIISNDTNSTLPPQIESKLIDSLCGKDQADRVVPDLSLPPKARYGIETRPRQSMFINRFEALKEYIERVNSVLLSYTVVEDRNISDLSSYEALPSTITGLYDTVVDTEAELRFIGTSTFKPATLTAVITDGRITGVKIVDAGQGYVNSPYIDVTSHSGVNATIKSVLNARGQITSVIIENSGEGYDDRSDILNNPYTQLSVRSLSALVKTDTGANGVWSIYSYNPGTYTWSRIRSQSYDVRKYWSYVDWYATGYNQFDAVDYSVDATYLLNSINPSIGQLVKVKSVGSGGWLLLEKYADSTSIDFTQSYRIIGRQNGTIQLTSALYKFTNTNLGYDGPLYDGDSYDNTAAKELRIILTALKDKILIDDLKQEHLDAFFAALRYAFSEQTYIDYAFKTSFVRAQHNVGPLKEKVTYNNDNLTDFEDYINEVKPYRTKVREFVSSYTGIDNTESVITDFDVPSIYVDNKLESIYTSAADGKITSNYSRILDYPWKHWLDNVGFEVTEIRIINGGSGYLSAPQVNIINDSGSGAVAKAYISNGVVNRIVLLSKGSGYLKTPTISFDGGLNVGGKPAKAVAIIGDSKIRSNLIQVKFDRVSGQYFITKLQETETFIASGSQLTFNLKWAPKITQGDASIKINGIDALYGTYSLAVKKSISRGYTSYYGTLTFTSPPTKGATITITYIKDFQYLSAADRINYYYNPGTKELGKDPAQLMQGVDYGGVQIVGLGFSVPKGWNSLPWFTDGWDALDPTFEDYIILINADNNGHAFTLPYTPKAGEQINVYISRYNDVTYKNAPGIRLDDLHYPGVPMLDKPTVIMQTFVGDGTTKVINLPTSLVININDEIIFRKSTSDGSIKPLENDYDTSLSGGNLAYSSATGLVADDIIVDGDGLVTANTSHGPEEVVPGQIVDTLAIKVTTRPNDGSANISYNNYVYNGSTLAYPLGLTPNSPQAVAVLFSNLKRPLVIDIDYTVDYKNQLVNLITIPRVNAVISVITFGYSGAGLLETDYFIADGKTNEYITGASWPANGVNGIVYVNGQVVPYELFKTDDTYSSANLVGIRFTSKITKNYLINYAIVNSSENSFSVMKSETFTADGATRTFNLKNKIGDALPLESNMIVYSDHDNSVYNTPSGTYYIVENNQLEYSVPVGRTPPYSVDAVNISVLIDGKLLNQGKDYSLDLSVISIKLSQKTYNANVGKEIVISINTTNSYTSNGTSITFNTAPTADTRLTVLSFYKHDSLDIKRTGLVVTNNVEVTPDTVQYYEHIEVYGKRIRLDLPVINDARVWITKNGKLLQQSIDYKLNSDLSSVQLSDEPVNGDKFTIMTFGSNVVRSAFSFMQFKDMLNRDHYKRLSRFRETMLMQDLHYNDIEIVVEDDRVLNTPSGQTNQPGIIYINGERIEYFTKIGNVLSQLRRGTLGTGVKSVYLAGTKVQDIGATETIPYKDNIVVEQLTSDGTSKVYALTNIKTFADLATISPTWYKSTIPASYGQSNELDVFVGGYDILGDWSANISYVIGDLVMFGTYTFRCTIAHTSSTSFYADYDPNSADNSKWRLFVPNIRLKKQPYLVHNVNKHYESPEGDVLIEADFSVRGTKDNLVNEVRLTNVLSQGTKFTVIKKTGKLWEDQDSSLAGSKNAVSRFILADLDLLDSITDINGQPLTDNDGNILEL